MPAARSSLVKPFSQRLAGERKRLVQEELVDRQVGVANFGGVVAASQADLEVAADVGFDIELGAAAVGLGGVDQAVDVRVAADDRQLLVLDVEVVDAVPVVLRWCTLNSALTAALGVYGSCNRSACSL